MNFMQTTHIIGQSKLPLKYNDDELDKLIGAYIAETREFSFSQLCNHILYTADQQNMLEKQPNTTYSQIHLTNSDKLRITKNLWERIWAKELILLFNDPQDMHHRNNETYFLINQK